MVTNILNFNLSDIRTVYHFPLVVGEKTVAFLDLVQMLLFFCMIEFEVLDVTANFVHTMIFEIASEPLQFISESCVNQYNLRIRRSWASNIVFQPCSLCTEIFFLPFSSTLRWSVLFFNCVLLSFLCDWSFFPFRSLQNIVVPFLLFEKLGQCSFHSSFLCL